MSSSWGRAPLGWDRVMTTWFPVPWMEETDERRAAYREAGARAVWRAWAATSPVRGVPSEKVMPVWRVKVQVRPSELTT